MFTTWFRYVLHLKVVSSTFRQSSPNPIFVWRSSRADEFQIRRCSALNDFDLGGLWHKTKSRFGISPAAAYLATSPARGQLVSVALRSSPWLCNFTSLATPPNCLGFTAVPTREGLRPDAKKPPISAGGLDINLRLGNLDSWLCQQS